ncbi:hypothetical protein LL037_14015 [Clostridium estertheticum]|uniref:hypothetical protein n=1 Tax=Clostridium estertheticum TaxID=238834 RepID=UPI001C0C6E00|nr:hypothetical protein [Clostridium estertheticum]MBU3199139.1 hypothetical protein [Clostridium estertheticum]WAG63600.1 hypothetical protein LL037_14015 [Clostridium estertheticum]
MINIIKTAILTILISFASGLLLDYYKNLGPRILCNIRKGKPTDIDSEEDCGYVITVKNPSNRTIHELTINIGSQTKLRSTDAQITRGLKFDSSINDNILEVYIPFISKGDEFSVTVYLEDQHNKPVIVIKSPENFKEIYSGEQNEILALLLNIPTNIKHLISKETKKSEEVHSVDKEDFTTVMSKVTGDEQTINKSNREVFPENKKLSKNKKKIIVVAIILVLIGGVSGEVYSKMTAGNTPIPTVKTVVPQKSTVEKESSGQSTENKGTKKSVDKINETTSTKKSVDKTNETTGKKAATEKSTGTAGTKESTAGTTPAAGSKEGTTETIPAAGSKDGTAGTPTAGSTDGKTETTPNAGSTTETTPATGGTTGTTGGTTGN